jgi:hypothetical protein
LLAERENLSIGIGVPNVASGTTVGCGQLTF